VILIHGDTYSELHLAEPANDKTAPNYHHHHHQFILEIQNYNQYLQTFGYNLFCMILNYEKSSVKIKTYFEYLALNYCESIPSSSA